MGRTKRKVSVPLATIWEIPDPVWDQLQPILAANYPTPPTGRPRINLRRALNGIIFRLRTGCQWNQLPKVFGDDSSVHRWFQRWVADDLFDQLWAVLLRECEELGGVDWEWQAVDGCLGKARFGGEKDRSQPHRPRQAGDQEESGGGSRRRSVRGGHRRRQYPGCATAA
jgi:putative transposase